MNTFVSDPAEQLEQVRSNLEREFGATLSPAALDAAARQALSRFASARIAAFVPLLATREARAILGAGGRG